MHYLIMTAAFALAALSIHSFINRVPARGPARKNRHH